ncbi:hypothetical protein AAE478_008001 [Parahypoxylon ruwenzoriense]
MRGPKAKALTPKMSDKPVTTDEERAHGAVMADQMDRQDDRDRDEVRASDDLAPAYREDASNDPPAYDPVEAMEPPEYTDQPSFEEWMRGGDDGD